MDSVNLRYCATCDKFPWLITKAEKTELSQATNDSTIKSGVVAVEGKETILTRLNYFEKTLNKEQVIEASLKGKKELKASRYYLSDGLIPKSTEERVTAIRQGDSILVKTEKQVVFPIELLFLFLSAILFGLAWVFAQEDDESQILTKNPGGWMLALAATSACLCGAAVFGLQVKPPSESVLFFMLMGGFMGGFLCLVVYASILVIIMLIVHGLLKIFFKKSTFKEEWLMTISIYATLIVTPLLMSGILPLLSSPKNTVSSLFLVFFPGLITAILGKIVVNTFFRHKNNKKKINH